MIEIVNDTAHSKFKTTVNGVECKIVYKRLDDGAYDLIHTIVPPAAEGQGVASALVKFAIETAKAEGVKIVDTCPYVKAWFVKHPEERGILREKR